MLTFILLFATISLSWPLGIYLTWVLEPRTLGRYRNTFQKLAIFLLGKFIVKQQNWKSYATSLLIFNLLMFIVSFLILLFQGHLPLNPDGKTNVELWLAFNTAASFTTNTNLQHYSGEVVMSYFSQLYGLMWLQFVSAATGISALAALARGLRGNVYVGNFFADVWNVTALILLPLALLLASILALNGTPMTFDGAAVATTIEGVTQTIARGPAAAFIAIKQLGTNGGGFFGPNSAHPFENPSYWTNLFSNIAILLLPMASVWMFGRIAERLKHAAVLFSVMLTLLLSLLVSALYTESMPAAALEGLSVSASSNLEGKELRFGEQAGAVWAVSTTASSNGSVNAMHDSLNPLTGLVAMTGLWLNVVFGGVGVGVINLFIFVIIAVFIAGMMVGRTPEYLNRKVEVKEMQLALFALLLHPFLLLGGVALFVVTPFGLATIQELGSHGFSEIVYEFSSAVANNGSGFEGLGDNTAAWNIATGIIMLLARFIPIIAPLAIVGSLAAKKSIPETSGTLRVDTSLFAIVLLSTVLVIGALLFLPLAMLGPIAEHLTLSSL